MTNKLEKDRDERARDKGRMAEVEKGSQISTGEGKLFEAVEENGKIKHLQNRTRPCYDSGRKACRYVGATGSSRNQQGYVSVYFHVCSIAQSNRLLPMLTLATGGFAGSNREHKATEVARLLAELNDVVEGVADTKTLIPLSPNINLETRTYNK